MLNMFPSTEKPPNEFTREVGALVRQARDEAGLSQSQLAHMIEVHRNTITNIETGKVELAVAYLIRLAIVLERPIGYFIPNSRFYNPAEQYLSEGERKVLIHFRRLNSKSRELLLVQIAALADYDEQDALRDELEVYAEEMERLEAEHEASSREQAEHSEELEAHSQMEHIREEARKRAKGKEFEQDNDD